MVRKMEKIEDKIYPNFAECERLWQKHNTPSHVIGHCKEVSRVAVLLAKHLQTKGILLNIPLLQSAGWLHDIKRAEEEHWEKGAQIAHDLGFDDLANVIFHHMSYRIEGPKKDITELDILCLADRMVLEDQFVGLDLRMDYIIKKSQDDKNAEERIRKSFSQTALFLQQVEDLIGTKICEIMK